MSGYNFRNLDYPHFYPIVDDYNPDCYIVAFSLTCYPYRHGSQFDENAFPPELRGLGKNGNTKFCFIAEDERGHACEGLDWEEASFIADRYNEIFHDLVEERNESWDWENFPFKLNLNRILYSK